jgi:hypothetical protein
MIRWRDDGRELYYLASDGNMMAVPITTTPNFKAGQPTPLFRMPPDFPMAGSPGQIADISGDGQVFSALLPVPFGTWTQPAPIVNEGGVRVSGVVIREGGQPLVGVQVRLLNTMGGPTVIEDLPHANVASDGSFAFPSVKPGTYGAMVGPNVVMQPITVEVANRDTQGLRLVIPETGSVTGTVLVEGGGPRPRFSMTFESVTARPDAASAANSPIVMPVGRLIVVSGFQQTIVPPVNEVFSGPVPPGEYRVTARDLPDGYSVRSITAAAADLMTQTLKILPSRPVSIVVRLGVSSPPPWFKVSGRVIGRAEPSTSAVSTPSIQINGPASSENLIVPLFVDGTFEFPRVLPGTYTARLTQPILGSGIVTISVENADVTNVEIAAPRTKEVVGRVRVEGGGPMPERLAFSVPPVAVRNTVGLATTTAIPVQTDGLFRIALPEGDYRITLVGNSVPAGYSVKSLMYGSTDLLSQVVAIKSTDSEELGVTLVRGGTR